MTDGKVEPPPVHVVEDDEDVRNAVDWTLRAAGYEVNSHGEARCFLEHFDATLPSCVLIDLLLPGMTGLNLCQELVLARANCVIVMISGHGDVSSAVEAMKLGAIDFLEKPCSRERLLAAMQKASDALKQRQREFANETHARKRLALLSPRERDVFDQMVEGLVSKEIASRLGISPRTVDVHRSKISQKLGLSSPTQLGHFVSLCKTQPTRSNYPSGM